MVLNIMKNIESYLRLKTIGTSVFINKLIEETIERSSDIFFRRLRMTSGTGMEMLLIRKTICSNPNSAIKLKSMRGLPFVWFVAIAIVALSAVFTSADEADALQRAPKLVNVEGTALLRQDMHSTSDWRAASRVLLDYGKYIGFLKEDGSFVIEGVPSGSYIVEVTNVEYTFEPVRVDISSKGKIRARRLNLLQPNAVTTLPYPLQMYARQPTKYFRVREEWRVTDVLMNPMVLMLLVAFFLLVVTPKLAAQDPQMQKEMQNVQMPKMDMPDMSDMLASLFGGGVASNKRGSSAAGSSSTDSTTKRSSAKRNRQ